jgi:hypothetical protein
MELTILRDRDAVQDLSPLWRDLPLANPFSSWEFARRWLEQPSVEPFLMVVKGDGGQLLALAPWSLRKKAGGLRLLEGIWGYDAWYHDPWIADPALADTVGDLLVEGLRQSRREWDALDLILSAGCSARLVERLTALGWGFTERPGDRQNRLIQFGDGWESYWKGRSKELRASLRQAQRKLDALPHRYIEADSETCLSLLEDALRFSQERWDPDRNRMLWYDAIRDLGAASAARGELAVFGIEIDGHLAAVNLAFRAGTGAYGTLQGYDPAFASYRLGTLLCAWALERMAASGIHWVDMGDGTMPWKERFKTAVTETVLIRLGASLSGKAFVGWKNWLKPQLSGILRSPAR